VTSSSNDDLIKSVAVIGLGYVGLPTAALLAMSGVNTLGVDINVGHINSLKAGKFVSRENGLNEVIAEATKLSRLSFSTEIKSSDAYIIAVPTPVDDTRTPDMTYVLRAAESIAKVIKPGQLVVLESTSPPGATKQIVRKIGELRPELDVSGEGKDAIKFAYCPERVLPGDALYEIVHNERLIGGLTKDSERDAIRLYSNFSRGAIVACSDEEAEVAKLVENSYRDVNIAFANEVARISSKIGVRADAVISLANRHPRVNILNPGIGVGGHCISVDPWFLVYSAPEESALIRVARSVNDSQPLRLAERVLEVASNKVLKHVYVLGLTYKPNSDDLRESPSLSFARHLLRNGLEAALHLVDPVLSQEQIETLSREFPSVSQGKPNFESDSVVVITVDHDQFKSWDFKGTTIIRLPNIGQVIPDAND